MHSSVRLFVVLGLFACSPSRGDNHAKREAVAATERERPPLLAPETAAVSPSSPADAERGGTLVVSFECNRCHDGTGHPAMATERHCTHCHEDIETGRFGAGAAKIAEWRRSVAPYRYAPSLESMGGRFRREWIAHFLQNPEDLRPNLAATMPRLSISPGQAADLAAYLTRDDSMDHPQTPIEGNLDHGRALMEAKGCGSCHAFTGAPPLPSVPVLTMGSDSQKKAIALAPDLRHARARFRSDKLVEWLLAPSSLKADTPMPSHSLTRQEATDIAAYVTRVALEAPSRPALPTHLPLLARPVTYREVEARVLGVTCRHCHGDPDVAGGDGGPGNTGGFGFPPRGLDLSTYRSAAAGVIRDDGQRHSLFERTVDGTPILVAALRARESEEAGQSVPGIRGMPLGLPAVSPEDVALVETWIAQGRPR